MAWELLGTLGAALSGGADIANSIISAKAAKQQNALNRETLDYNKELNKTQMEREDTALQRRMADAQAAGLNPLSVLGSAAESGAGGFLTAPDVASPTIYSGALDQVNQIMQGKKLDNAQKELDAALQKADDEHQAALDAQAIAEQTIEGLKLDNEAKSAENSVLADKLSKEIDALTLKNGQLVEEINLLKKQQQTESTKQQLNTAEAALAQSRAEQQVLETQLYEQYEPQERAYKIQILSEEMSRMVLDRLHAAKEYTASEQEQELDNQIKTLSLYILEHDLPLYLESTLPSSVVDKGAQTQKGKSNQDLQILYESLGRDDFDKALKAWMVANNLAWDVGTFGKVGNQIWFTIKKLFGGK